MWGKQYRAYPYIVYSLRDKFIVKSEKGYSPYIMDTPLAYWLCSQQVDFLQNLTL